MSQVWPSNRRSFGNIVKVWECMELRGDGKGDGDARVVNGMVREVTVSEVEKS